ncbi:hypothetical protein [Amycolatopsis albispora]|uniref:Uncharacterized protein n=1 Tax=Amycolatopsis albispora TaxID=1804986 RepID=A0A344LEL5_9PSEU|nr:hypothetical protein [Amycolatopsis albispora]AXB46489.1 hypothetical protein A4R43_31885 [Amycolatopsis albispora]
MTFEEPPEPARKPAPTALLAGLAAAVLVLVVLGFTAFVAPGFLVGDPGPVAAPATTTSSAPARTTTSAPSPRPAETAAPTSAEPAPGGRGGSGPADASVEKVIKDFVAELNAGDANGAKQLMCAGGRGDDSAVGALAAQQPSLEVGELTAKSSKVLTGTVTGTAGGQPVTASVTATAAIGEACVGLFTVS